MSPLSEGSVGSPCWHGPLVPLPGSQHLGLVVVLHGHGDDIEADDKRDEEIQVVAGAQCVDGATCMRVVSVVGSALGLCGERAGQCSGGHQDVSISFQEAKGGVAQREPGWSPGAHMRLKEAVLFGKGSH